MRILSIIALAALTLGFAACAKHQPTTTTTTGDGKSTHHHHGYKK